MKDSFLGKLPKAVMSLGVFAFFSLTFLNNQLNFDIPANAKIRDAADFSKSFEIKEKIDPKEVADKEIATGITRVAYVPVTTSYYYTGANYIANLFHINNPTPVSSPAVDAGAGVMRYMGYGGRFLYGHSTMGFSRLKTLYVGDTFTVTMDGGTATYRVVQRYVFNKGAELDGAANSSRRARIYSAVDENGASHALSLMTCGNGANNDANYRLVLFADRI